MSAEKTHKIGEQIKGLKTDVKQSLAIVVLALPAPPLKPGDKGPKVLELQKILVQLERLSASHESSNFDASTAKGLGAFLHDWGFKTTEGYDANARNALAHALAGAKPKVNVHETPIVVPPNGPKVVAIAEQYLNKYESELEKEGVTQKGVDTSESCANFVSAMLKKAKVIDFHVDLVSDLNKRLRAKGWKQVSKAQSKPGDVWICETKAESHTELVARNNKGDITLIGSNNHPHRNDQQINYDHYSANEITTSFILQPPK
jgi:hypothetical protein